MVHLSLVVNAKTKEQLGDLLKKTQPFDQSVSFFCLKKVCFNNETTIKTQIL
jgi:hypothetical protein